LLKFQLDLMVNEAGIWILLREHSVEKLGSTHVRKWHPTLVWQ